MKPSKKTKWEKEYDELFSPISDHPDAIALHKIVSDAIKDFIRTVIHQRDNEIREKIQRVLKYPTGNLILDGKIKKIFTYLSNKEA